MWAISTCWFMPLMSITAPQKHLNWPLASCVGNLHPESRIAYFHAVQARCFRYSSKSASVRLARKTRRASSKSIRAFSRLVEGGGRAGRAFLWIAARIEAAAPAPRVGVGRIARAHGDRADAHVAVIDQPGRLRGVGVCGGVSGSACPMILRIAPGVKPLQLGALAIRAYIIN
jgi:hypothetical protein